MACFFPSFSLIAPALFSFPLNFFLSSHSCARPCRCSSLVATSACAIFTRDRQSSCRIIQLGKRCDARKLECAGCLSVWRCCCASAAFDGYATAASVSVWLAMACCVDGLSSAVFLFSYSCRVSSTELPACIRRFFLSRPPSLSDPSLCLFPVFLSFCAFSHFFAFVSFPPLSPGLYACASLLSHFLSVPRFLFLLLESSQGTTSLLHLI